MSEEKLLWSAPVGERSQVRVREKDGVRRLLFWDGEKEAEEARMQVSDPDLLPAFYLRQMLAASCLLPALSEEEGVLQASELQGLVQPEPKVLVIGLGAGLLSRQLARVHPSAEVVSVEISPEVAEAAQKFFYYRPDSRQKLVIADGRSYLEESAGELYDLVILDAFDGLEVPADLRTVEFFELLRQRLKSDGFIVLNLHYAPLSARERYSAAMRSVFHEAYLLPGMAQGVVVLKTGSGDFQPLLDSLEAGRLPELSKLYRLPLAELLGSAEPLSRPSAEPYRDPLGSVDTQESPGGRAGSSKEH